MLACMKLWYTVTGFAHYYLDSNPCASQCFRLEETYISLHSNQREARPPLRQMSEASPERDVSGGLSRGLFRDVYECIWVIRSCDVCCLYLGRT